MYFLLYYPFINHVNYFLREMVFEIILNNEIHFFSFQIDLYF